MGHKQSCTFSLDNICYTNSFTEYTVDVLFSEQVRFTSPKYVLYLSDGKTFPALENKFCWISKRIRICYGNIYYSYIAF